MLGSITALTLVLGAVGQMTGIPSPGAPLTGAYVLRTPLAALPNAVVLPNSCAAGSYLWWNTGEFACVALPAPLLVPTCAAGERLTANGTSLSCVAQPAYLVTFSVGAKLSDAEVLRHVLTEAVTFPAGLTGAKGNATTTATGSAQHLIRKKTPGQAAVGIGYVTFAAGAEQPTFDFVNPVAFAAGDVLEIMGPGTADATLANWTVTLRGTR